MFSRAIVRIPCKELINGITTVNLGLPDYEKALIQHREYVDALKKCGLEIIELNADNRFPDSTFIEDTALLTPECAVITNPGALPRKGEIAKIKKVLKNIFDKLELIQSPGTLDAGDILNVDSRYYIGLSQRTNSAGAEQLIEILDKYGFSASTVPLKNILHLKSGISYLGYNTMLISREFINEPVFQKYDLIQVDDDESYAANCIRVNDYVLIAKGFPKTKLKIENNGYSVMELDVSEFRKLDGGLSCLSLRF